MGFCARSAANKRDDKSANRLNTQNNSKEEEIKRKRKTTTTQTKHRVTAKARDREKPRWLDGNECEGGMM